MVVQRRLCLSSTSSSSSTSSDIRDGPSSLQSRLTVGVLQSSSCSSEDALASCVYAALLDACRNVVVGVFGFDEDPVSQRPRCVFHGELPNGLTAQLTIEVVAPTKASSGTSASSSGCGKVVLRVEVPCLALALLLQGAAGTGADGSLLLDDAVAVDVSGVAEFSCRSAAAAGAEHLSLVEECLRGSSVDSPEGERLLDAENLLLQMLPLLADAAESTVAAVEESSPSSTAPQKQLGAGWALGAADWALSGDAALFIIDHMRKPKEYTDAICDIVGSSDVSSGGVGRIIRAHVFSFVSSAHVYVVITDVSIAKRRGREESATRQPSMGARNQCFSRFQREIKTRTIDVDSKGRPCKERQLRLMDLVRVSANDTPAAPQGVGGSSTKTVRCDSLGVLGSVEDLAGAVESAATEVSYGLPTLDALCTKGLPFFTPLPTLGSALSDWVYQHLLDVSRSK